MIKFLLQKKQEKPLKLNIDLLVSALFGGEDYELLFTVSLADFEKIKNNLIYSPIGHISKDVNGVKLYDSSGKSVEINHNSWTAFQKIKYVGF